MKKRMFLLLLCFALLIPTVAACGGRKETPVTPTEKETNDPEETGKTEEPEEPTVPTDLPTATISFNSETSWVKLLDNRMEKTELGITCDWTCAGIEFCAECMGTVTIRYSATQSAYFRAFVDGEVWKNGTTEYFTVNPGTSGNITLRNIPYGNHTIRLVKVTGYTLSNVMLHSVTLTGHPAEEAPAKKELFLEFVGDSICCGWGTIGAHDGTFSAQDGTLAYPYLIAESMNADYSVVAVSGQGVIFGNPNISNAYRYASYNRDKTNEFGFERKADIVVLNVGTNDSFNKTTSMISSEAYKKAFKSLVKYIREKNGYECKIVAVYGMMNDTFGEEAKEVIDSLGGAERNYFTLEVPKDASGHPTVAEHAAYAKTIEAFLKETVIPNVPLPGPEPEEEEDPEEPEEPTAGLKNGGENGKALVVDYGQLIKD